MVRNKEAEQALTELPDCEGKQILETYIDKLERENYGLKVTNRNLTIKTNRMYELLYGTGGRYRRENKTRR